MRTLLSLVVLLFSHSVFAMEGTVTVKSGSWRVQREDDGMKVHFYPGRYQTTLSFERNSLFFTVLRNDIATNARLVLPAGAQLPENGAVDIDGFRSGQTFAAKGTISTNRTTTQDYSGREGCVFYRQEWVCHGYGQNYHCDWETVPEQGSQQVQYHFETKTVDLALALDSHDGGDASFAGHAEDSQKIYTFRGECY